MNFVRLLKKDIDLILSVQKDNFKDGWNKAQLISAFDGGNFYALAIEEGGVTVGIITYSLSFDTADIESVVVVSSERKKGYGKLLVERAVLDLEERGVKSILLEVREFNLPAIALYTACGFSKISVRKKYYFDGENAVIMQKEL